MRFRLILNKISATERHVLLRRAENGWNSANVGVPLWLAFFCLWLYWHSYSRLPTPGKAIGVLAIVAGIMSIRHMRVAAKATWLLLLFFLLRTEFRAIDKDHYDNEQAQVRFFNEQKQGFTNVAGQASVNFETTTSKLQQSVTTLEAISTSTQHVASLAQRNLEQVTGGRSYGYLTPDTLEGSDHFFYQLHNAGDEILTGVSVSIFKIVSECPQVPAEGCTLDGGGIHPLMWPILAGHSQQIMPDIVTPTLPSRYLIQIAAQNGAVSEDIWFRTSLKKQGISFRLFVYRVKNGRKSLRQPIYSTGWREPEEMPAALKRSH